VKIPAGKRIARWALATQHGMEEAFPWLPPVITETQSQDGALVLKFDQQVGGPSDGSPMTGFAIAGEDMKFQPATVNHRVVGKSGRRVKYDSTTLILKSPLVPHPVHYRYAWGRNPMGNVQANRGSDTPLATQRSDAWTNGDLLKALTGKEAENPMVLNRGETRKLQEALAAEDRRRMAEEAKALLRQQSSE